MSKAKNIKHLTVKLLSLDTVEYSGSVYLTGQSNVISYEHISTTDLPYEH